MDPKADWQKLYWAALLEVDAAKLPVRIAQAYQAIQSELIATQTALTAKL